jgi:hypothetical protein
MTKSDDDDAQENDNDSDSPRKNAEIVDKSSDNQLSADHVEEIIRRQAHLSISSSSADQILICDAGYGLPREARPRKEKTLAIARQLANFLSFQQEFSKKHSQQVATVKVVGCSNEEDLLALRERTTELYGQPRLPSHISFSCQALEDYCHEKDIEEEAIYLSPDADNILDPSEKPPANAIVGLLIDRRVQPNRSQERASKLKIRASRWPLETFFQNIHSNEPLNVDCILEGMQQWYWNWNDDDSPMFQNDKKECFVQACTLALSRHAERHPSRPLHKT